MYAVIKTGGKQYRVAVGDKIKVESMKAEEGEKITLDQVLMITDGDKVSVGTPTLDTAVEATVLANGRGKKLRIVKFRRRQNSRTRTGHRQNYTQLEITAIGGKGASKDKPAAPKKAAAKPTAKDSTAAPVKAKASPEAAPKAKVKTKAGTSKADTGAAAIDDLSRISGVGPVIVGKLTNMGITTFQQIADLSAEDIERIDGELNFKGRIERDEWVKQAKEFLKG